MRKTAVILGLVISLSMFSGNQAQASTGIFSLGSNSYSIDNRTFASDAKPFLADGRTYVPVRYLAEACGVNNILWDKSSNTILLTKGNVQVKLFPGQKVFVRNDETSYMDVAPVMIDGRTYLPARFVAEAFGYSVVFSNGQVIISSDNISHYESVPAIGIHDFAIAGVRLYMPREQIVQVLGQPQNITEKLGMDSYLQLDYPGLSIDTYNYEDWTASCSIEITSPDYPTARGLKVGDSRSRVIELYGKPLNENENGIYYQDLTSVETDEPNGQIHYPRGINIELCNGVVSKIQFYDQGW